ncbi:MAG: class I SAM-dependent methyltransferase, partial [Lachnospiraceae bacterium]|nr:class I SAM-dependent methyltransferase [Lachnospiraceae bacterium]
LKELEEGEADTVLIAGMGGFLMRRILCEEAVPESVSELVLQPQSDICEVRRCVRELAFVIVDEDMVEEDGKFYPMMKAKRGRKLCDRAEPSPCEDFFGPILLQKRHPVLKRWLEKEKMTAETILNQLDAACAGQMPDDRPDRMPVDRLILRRNEILQRRDLLLYALNYYR